MQRMNNAGLQIGAELKKCVNIVASNPDIQILNDKTELKNPENIVSMSLQMLNDNSFATDDEKKALLKAHTLIQPCRRKFLSELQIEIPVFVALFANMWSRVDDNTSDLLNEKISWGQFNRKGRDLAISTNRKLLKMANDLQKQLSRENYSELQQRQAASQALLNYYQEQQRINSLYRPTLTNCTSIGNTINCSSY